MQVLLVRHAESYANKADFTAFGNEDSPLTEHGEQEAFNLGHRLIHEYGVDLGTVPAASEFTRAQQTAQGAGFVDFDVLPILNESDLDPAEFDWTDANKPMDKHVREHWVPFETLNRAEQFLHDVRMHKINYPVYFTHGLFIASALMFCEEVGLPQSRTFDPVRGYVPLRAEVVPIEI